LSLIFRAFQGLCINEFKGLQFEQQHSYDIQTGEQVVFGDIQQKKKLTKRELGQMQGKLLGLKSCNAF
jgi:hypothetical protein